MGGAGLWFVWLATVAAVASATTPHDTVASTPPNYKECDLGKGQVKLYNCGRKYDINGTRKAHLSKIEIPARYVLKLKANETGRTVDDICERAEANRGGHYQGTCIHKYTKVWLGMLMMINGGNLSALLVREAPSVDHVEVDGTLRVCGSIVQGAPPNWGLDRIDHLPGQSLLNSLYASSASGEGVHVYILDTGIRCSHKDFTFRDGRLNATSQQPQTRCVNGFDGIKDGSGTDDCNGHGTHCAGIVGGVKTGVAKDVWLHPVRVMGCDGSGSFGAIIAGLDWVSHNLIRPAVLSMSIATQASISIDQAVNNMVNTTGIIGIAAAGNFLQESCNYSPARAASVITVGSSNSVNEMSWFSNYGTCTTMFAPGELVYSTYSSSDTSYATLSGTSMACPHVAGAAALYLSQNPEARPVDVRQSLMDATEPYAVSTTNLKPGTTTKLLNTNMKQPFFNISPRSFYQAFEGTTNPIVVTILYKPGVSVFLTPDTDSTIGYFSPKYLLFSPMTWSNPQTINLVLITDSDFLDHSSTIQWVFTSKDTRFVASPQGWVTSQDTGVCKRTPTNNCGQNVDNPKIIPSLPFYYVDDSSHYQNIYDVDFDPSCHSSGPDLLFQYTPPTNTIVNISLCGTITSFDSLLSIYDSKKLGKQGTLTKVSCNDDNCGPRSFLTNVPLLGGHNYIIMIDGFQGAGGPLDLYVYGPGAPLVPSIQAIPTSIPVIISSFSASIQSAQAICTRWKGTNCQPPPPPLPIQAGFFWSTISWGPCDKTCGGGFQQAVMQCYTGNYTKTENYNCAKVPVPSIIQACNLVACKNFSAFEGPWNECSHTCGAGTQKRVVVCMDNLGNTAHPDRCGGESLFSKIQYCNIHPCNDTHWESAPWNYCNVPCSGGRKYRDPVCYSNGAVVDDDLCSDLPTPIKELDCNTQPCQTYAWLIGRWDDCPFVCNATKDRVVQCVDGGGHIVAEDFCDFSTKPKTRTPCQQRSVVCDFCAHNNCSGNGVCQKGTCICTNNWEGDYCERPTVCKGNPMGFWLDGTVKCCPYTTIDTKQNCCMSEGAKIDADGGCCAGHLDACGICNGPHLSIDSQNQCCPTIRDEKGLCCLSGKLDECYICDGDGTTCATNITILALLDESLDVTKNSSINWKAFMIQFMMKVATRLNVATEALLLTGVQTMNSLTGDCGTVAEMQVGCLGTGTVEFLGLFNFSVLPIPSKNLTIMAIEGIDISSNLRDPGDDPHGKFVPGVKIRSVLNVQRAGICGNGMCERGERCNQNGGSVTTTGGSCCLADCPYVPSPCPISLEGPKQGMPCSKNGICLDASGQCDCFEGYHGDTCDLCLTGWTQMPDGHCMKVMDAVGVQKMSTKFNLSKVGTIDAAWNDKITISKGTAATAIIGTMICMTIFLGFIFLAYKHYHPNLPGRPDNHFIGTGSAAHGIQMQSNLNASNNEEEERKARQSRRDSLRDERREAVQERMKSKTYGPVHNAVRKSLLMQPSTVTPTAGKSGLLPPAYTPAPMTQVDQPGVFGELRKSFTRDGGVISGWRKSFVGDSTYSMLDPSAYMDEEHNYRNPSATTSTGEDQNFRNPAGASSSNFFRGPSSPSESDLL